jgi:hypothetical protein
MQAMPVKALPGGGNDLVTAGIPLLRGNLGQSDPFWPQACFLIGLALEINFRNQSRQSYYKEGIFVLREKCNHEN